MSWGGVPLNARTAAMMDEAQALYGATITATKGSPVPGGGPSAFTHAGEGAIDVDGADLDAIETAMRRVGFAAWHRTRAEGFAPHVHGVAVGEPGLYDPDATDQVASYFAGRNGLISDAPDTGTRAYVGVTWETYNGGIADGTDARVYRGEQMTVDSLSLNGSFDSAAFTALDGRDDAVAFTLAAGDVLCIFVLSNETQAGDVWSMVNWRLNASGHGTLALSEGFDDGYTETIPAVLTDLGSLVLDTDTFGLTATVSHFTQADADRLRNDGYAALRIECTAGTVALDWACLQVDTPGGLLNVTGGHWSSWITPALVPKGPRFKSDGYTTDASSGTPRDEAVANSLLSTVVAAINSHSFDYSPPWADGGGASTMATVSFSVQVLTFTPGSKVTGTIAPGVLLHWEEFPDFRQQPDGLAGLIAADDAVVNPDTGTSYEFAAGDTVTDRWRPAEMLIYYVQGGIGAQDDGSDLATFSVDVAGTLGQSTDEPTTIITRPDFTLVGASLFDTFNMTFSAGADSMVNATTSYLSGSTLHFPSNIVALGDSISRFWVGQAAVSLDLQMPDFRFWEAEWTRSPDALDTSDPEGVVVTWLRQRQRNDGLGNSITRARGVSSQQNSLRQRGYR